MSNSIFEKDISNSNRNEENLIFSDMQLKQNKKHTQTSHLDTMNYFFELDILCMNLKPNG